MKLEQYNYILDNYRLLRAKYGIDLRAIINQLVEMFCQNSSSNDENSITQPMIYSLVGYEFQRQMRSTIPKVNWISIINQWINNDNKSLLCLAKDYGISAAIVAQHVLQYQSNYDKTKAKKCFTNSSLINNGRLAFEVMICNLNDVIYGNHANHITNNSGLVFESEISQHLKNNNISYMTERDLRSNSFDVTPDFRLNLPIILNINKHNKFIINLIKFNQCLNEDSTQPIQSNDESDYENVVITWVECKSLFASIECHSDYYNNQFSSYINRFGNGLVLYKHGFVRDVPGKFSQNIVIADKFPKITQHK